jgi:hypothetical protein
LFPRGIEQRQNFCLSNPKEKRRIDVFSKREREETEGLDGPSNPKRVQDTVDVFSKRDR